jgi:hypothetical protein
VTVGLVTVLPVVASLVTVASVEGELGVRAGGRTSTIAVTGFDPDTRVSYSLAPRAAVLLDASRLRLAGAYAPRVWTSDVEEQLSPIVTHELEVRLETRHDRPWSAAASTGVVRGRTDPLADPYRATTTVAGLNQEPTTEPLGYEALQASVRGEAAIDLRNRIAAGAAWSVSRATDAESRALLPSQRGIALDVLATHLATERDVLRLGAGARSVDTWLPDGRARSELVSASATWRRRLSPAVNGWAGGGAALGREDAPGSEAERSWVPLAEVGVARDAEGRRPGLEVTARLAPFVDRFTGDLSSMAEGSLALRWQVSTDVLLRASASAGARTDGETALGLLTASATWTLRERLGVEAGIVARWQHERREEVPSFLEGGVIAAVVYETGPL